MNIFVLDLNPAVAATYHTDKHVVKMIVETAQLLCTAVRELDGSFNPLLYKPTHVNHPCGIWVRKSSKNYLWAYELFKELLKEYTYRYGKTHASSKLLEVLATPPKNIPYGELTPFAQAMPEEFRNQDPVVAYRNYYNGAKYHLHKWTKRPVPEFITGGK